MFWWILLILFALILATLLFAQLTLSLSSTDNLYFVSWGGFVKASAKIVQDDVEFRFHLFGFSKAVSLMEMAAGYNRKKSIPERVADEVVKTTRKRVPVNILVAFFKSFRVKRCYVNLDFGSVYYNAWLYPLGEIFRREHVHFTTNFEGKTDVEIQIVNRPGRILWAILTSYFKFKKS